MIVDTAHGIAGAAAHDHAARLALDLTTIAAALIAAASDALPHIIQIGAGALVIIRLWETDTVQGWANHWRAWRAKPEGDE